MLVSLFQVDRANAATFTVNSAVDAVDAVTNGICETAPGNGVCTLRAAIQEANANLLADTIVLPADTYTFTLAGIDEDAAETGDLDIADSLILEGAGAATTIVNAAGLDRVFHILAGASVSISAVTVRSGNPGNADGGGIFVEGDLTLTDSTVTLNTTTEEGGGIWVDTSGALTLIRTVLSENSAAKDGGGLLYRADASGTLTNVTLSGNSTDQDGGGIINYKTLTLTNVTIADNSAAASGGGILNKATGTSTLTNTLIADSVSGGNCSGTIDDDGFNQADDDTCGTIPNILTGLDPMLADNGGPTWTHALLAGSSAIDAGDNMVCPVNDQRRYLRTVGDCDVGAFEFDAPLPVTLASFETVASRLGTLVKWTTATELRSAGFNIYALVADRWQKLNPRLIPSAGDTVAPQRYRFAAHGVEGELFMLEELDVRGKRELHGPFAVDEAYGDPVVPAEAIDWPAIRAEHRTREMTRREAAGFVHRQSTPLASARPATGSDSSRWSRRRPARPDARGLELLVDETSLYRVTYEALRDAGLDLRGVSADDLALESRDEPVAIHVETGPGGRAEVFGPGAFFEFYGEALDTLYTKTNVYRLSLGPRQKARRIRVSKRSPSPQPPAPFYIERLEVEHNLHYNLTSPSDDPWFDTRLLAYGAAASATLDVVVDGYLAGAAPATLSLEMWGLSGWPQNPDHHLEVAFNGAPLAEEFFDDRVVHQITVELPADLLHEGANSLELRLPGDTGAAWDMVALDRFSITYPRQFLARDGRLTFEAAGRVFRVEGLPSPEVVVYRIEGGRMLRLTGARVEPSGTGHAVTFRGFPKPARYLVAASEALRVPGMRPARSGSGITADNADYLIISHPDFVADLERLVRARELQGLAVRVVDVEDVYARFSHGIFDPAAIRAFITYAAGQMGTESVLLVGGDSYDYHDYLGQGAISFLPSLYADTGSGVRYAPVDPLYADVDGDGVQDVALGRFPVRTRAELEALIAKTLDYADTGFGGSAVFAADASDSATGESFSDASDALATRLPGSWSVDRAYIDLLGVDGAREVLMAAIDRGVALTSFFGHSGPTVWSFQGLFNATDAVRLDNFRAPTVVTQWGCWNTYYVTPRFNTLAHKLLLSGEQGAAAVLGASTLTRSSSDTALGKLLLPRLVTPGVSLGTALRDAKQELAVTDPQRIDVLLGWTLLGDPALVIEP